jgi:hypothetical protein
MAGRPAARPVPATAGRTDGPARRGPAWIPAARAGRPAARFAGAWRPRGSGRSTRPTQPAATRPSRDELPQRRQPEPARPVRRCGGRATDARRPDAARRRPSGGGSSGCRPAVQLHRRPAADAGPGRWRPARPTPASRRANATWYAYAAGRSGPPRHWPPHGSRPSRTIGPIRGTGPIRSRASWCGRPVRSTRAAHCGRAVQPTQPVRRPGPVWRVAARPRWAWPTRHAARRTIRARPARGSGAARWPVRCGRPARPWTGRRPAEPATGSGRRPRPSRPGAARVRGRKPSATRQSGRLRAGHPGSTGNGRQPRRPAGTAKRRRRHAAALGPAGQRRCPRVPATGPRRSGRSTAFGWTAPPERCPAGRPHLPARVHAAAGWPWSRCAARGRFPEPTSR